MKRMISWISLHWLIMTGFILLTVTILSLLPPSKLNQLTELSSLSPSSLSSTLLLFLSAFSDKTYHFILYATLILPTAVRAPKRWGLIGLLFIGYSGVIELIQPYVSRDAEWLDFIANTCGVLLGSVLGRLLGMINP